MLPMVRSTVPRRDRFARSTPPGREICDAVRDESSIDVHMRPGGRDMGLFKKRSPERARPDDALSVFTASEARRFRAQVREVFAELGLEVTVHPDHAVDDAGRQFGLWNIATQCADEPPSRWHRLVRDHVERVLGSIDAPDPFVDLTPDEAARRTYARLRPEDGFPSPDAYPHREFVPGVVEVLALDLPDTVAVFNRESTDEFGGWDALRAHGLANLAALPTERVETLDAPDGGRFTALLGESVHTGSRALLLPDLATRLTGEGPSEFGWLMSVPNRHQVVWHVIRDRSVIPALNAMARFTMIGYSDAPGPVSPCVYWWNGTGYEQLTQVDDHGAISVHAGPAFTDLLNGLVAD